MPPQGAFIALPHINPFNIQPFNPAPMREWARIGIAGALILILLIEIVAFMAMAWESSLPIESIKDLIGLIFVPTITLAIAAVAFYFAGEH